MTLDAERPDSRNLYHWYSQLSCAPYMIRSAKPRSWQRDLVHENSRFLQVSGLRVKYTGPGDSDVHAACIRTCEPAVGALLYFEVKVLNQGRDGFIGTNRLQSRQKHGCLASLTYWAGLYGAMLHQRLRGISSTGIGFVEASFDAGRLPGWEPHTFGYHGDDGKVDLFPQHVDCLEQGV